jgi:hypothetical protein
LFAFVSLQDWAVTLAAADAFAAAVASPATHQRLRL